jgi:putative transposase
LQGGSDVQLAAELVEKARAEKVSLADPDGLLAGITKTVLQAALEAEMAEHLGYERGERPAVPTGNHATAPRPRRGRPGSGRCRSRSHGTGRASSPRGSCLSTPAVEGFDEAIISLYAKGLTAGEIRAHPG